jgi:CHAT domain-containing protein
MGNSVGLRRAIMTAGAETLVTSLWKIDDDITAQLMKDYYSRLLRGVGRVAAMQQAAQQVRQEYPHPYYWASFIVSGQAGPLRDYGSP